MAGRIEVGFMAFIADGSEGIGAVRSLSDNGVLIYVENAGEFVVPRSAILGVHSNKVMLDPKRLDKKLLDAVGHAHDREDPGVAG